MDCSLPGSSAHGIFQEGCHFLLQEIFLTQGLNPHLMNLLYWQLDSFTSVPPGKPHMYTYVYVLYIIYYSTMDNDILMIKSVKCLLTITATSLPVQFHENVIFDDWKIISGSPLNMEMVIPVTILKSRGWFCLNEVEFWNWRWTIYCEKINWGTLNFSRVYLSKHWFKLCSPKVALLQEQRERF